MTLDRRAHLRAVDAPPSVAAAAHGARGGPLLLRPRGAAHGARRAHSSRAPTTSAPSGTTPPAWPTRGRASSSTWRGCASRSAYTRELQVVDAGGAYQRFTSPTIDGLDARPPAADDRSLVRLRCAQGVDASRPACSRRTSPSPPIRRPSTASPLPRATRWAPTTARSPPCPAPGSPTSPVEELRVGLGVLAFVGKFQSTITFNANPQDRLLGAPEQPEYDANAQLDISPIFAPSANGGRHLRPRSKYIRFGVSGQLPMVISSPATITMQMPSSVVFDGASQDGTHAHVRFVLPAIARGGVEVRPMD